MLSVLEIYHLTVLINSEFVSAQGRWHTSRLVFYILTPTRTGKPTKKIKVLKFCPQFSFAALKYRFIWLVWLTQRMEGAEFVSKFWVKLQFCIT